MRVQGRNLPACGTYETNKNEQKKFLIIKRFIMTQQRTAPEIFDVIVGGAGHAGCEAAMALSGLGLNVLVITSNLDRIGHMSCNPAIGGLGKGHMVREIDALGGMMGRWADASGVQFRMLNSSKGPAVQAPRGQMDRKVYMEQVQQSLFSRDNIWFFQDFVASPLVKNGRVTGCVTDLGSRFSCRALLLTPGTFCGGMLHFGSVKIPGGRMGDAPGANITAGLRKLGIETGRLMTCTTPRLEKSSINLSAMQEQPGDDPIPQFSYTGPQPPLPQLSCYLTWTTPECHQVIHDALKTSPMYNGDIPGAGPRYCPAIEDKIARFPEKPRHQVFVEPEGLDSIETYPNNIPTGLPLEVQQAFLAKIPGLERARIIRAGYAVEYDFIPPTQLESTLEVKAMPGLWTAGQVNGTSGYEEAAAQGLWAALNIYCSLKGEKPFLPGRDQSYIAVLVDDLVTKGTNEPYRMLTSRAEHRLLLRHNNADLRLTEWGRKLGLVRDEQWNAFLVKKREVKEITTEMRQRIIRPDAPTRDMFKRLGQPAPYKAVSLAELMRRPGFGCEEAALFWPELMQYGKDARDEAAGAMLYSGYLDRQEEIARHQRRLEDVILTGVEYHKVHGLSAEAIDKLTAVQPRTLGQASRISGITPAALSCIEIYLKKLEKQKRMEK